MRRRLRAAALAAGVAAALASDLRAEKIASYRIACRYDDAKKSFEGTERLDWTNATSRPARTLRFLLPLNALRNNRSTYWREGRRRGAEPGTRDGAWSSSAISRMTDASGNDLLAHTRFVAPDDGNEEDRTVLEVVLENSVPPGGGLRLDIDFVSRLPGLGAAGGWKGAFALADGAFPAIGVLGEDGWRARQAHFGSEPRSGFADYDVILDFPARYRGRVAGSGRLIEERDAPGDRVLEHFHAEGIRGFALAADSGFEVETERVPAPGRGEVEITLLSAPEHRIYRPRFLRAARIAMAEIAKRYGPCPFPSIAIVDVPWGPGGAVEFFAPGFAAGRVRLLSPDGVWQDGSPEAIVFRGLAAQWFQEALSLEPGESARLDRAFTRYLAARIDRIAYGNSRAVLPLFGYPVVLRSVEVRPSATFSRASEPGAVELAWETFEQVAGEAQADPAVAAVLSELRGHETRADEFLGALERRSGPAWAAFFRAVLRGGALDYGVATATSRPSIPPLGLLESSGRTVEVEAGAAPRRRGYDSEVLVERRGDAAVPAEIRLDFEGAKTYRTVWNGNSGWIRLRVENGPRLVRAIVDPEDRIAIDRNRANNGRMLRSDAAAANLWTARAFFWSENLIDLFMELW